MNTRLSLLALALILPLAACESEPEVAEVEPVAVEAVEPMADTTMAPEVTAAGTVEAVQGAGGLLQLPLDAAIGNINGWIAQLEGNPDFAPVVADLETLRGQLEADPIDGAAVGTTLIALGEATTGAAGDNTDLQGLGEALTAAGNTLTGM